MINQDQFSGPDFIIFIGGTRCSASPDNDVLPASLIESYIQPDPIPEAATLPVTDPSTVDPRAASVCRAARLGGEERRRHTAPFDAAGRYASLHLLLPAQRQV